MNSSDKKTKFIRYANGPNAMGKIMYKVKKQFAPKAAGYETELALSWQEIVGEDIALNLSFGSLLKNNDGTHTLNVSVKTSSFAPKIHFMQDSILQKINTFFGFNLVTGIKINHLAEPLKIKPKKTPIELSSNENKLIETEVSDLENETLKNTLANLGKSILKNAKK